MGADLKNTLGLNAAQLINNTMTPSGTNMGISMTSNSTSDAIRVVQAVNLGDYKYGLNVQASIAQTTGGGAFVYLLLPAGSTRPVLQIQQAGTGDLLVFTSTTAAVRFPNMTSAQKNAINNAGGRVVFDTDLGKLCVNTGAGWQTITSA